MTETWVECPECEGTGGHVDMTDGVEQWIECPKCCGDEGWHE